MRERSVEGALVRRGKKQGIEFRKLLMKTYPDRITFLENGVTAFVECKRPGGRVRPDQQFTIRRLRKRGFRVYIIDRIEDIDEVIDELLEISA